MSSRFEFTKRARPILEIGLGSTVFDESAALWDVSLWDAPTSRWNGDEPLWRDVSCDIIEAHMELGRGRITDAYPVSIADIVVDNGSGWADPALQFEQDSVVGHLTFPGTEDNYFEIDDYPAISITGDICVVFRFRTEAWPPPAWTGWLAQKDGSYVVALVDDGTGGRLHLWSVNGATVNIHASDLITPTTDWRWYAVALDVNNGAGGHESRWYYGGNGDDPGVWYAAGGGVGAGVLAISDTANPLRLGTQVDDGFAGDISHMSIRSGIGPSVTVGGTTVFEFNGWDLTTADQTATSITPRVGPNPMEMIGTVAVTPAVTPNNTVLNMRPGRPIRIGVEHDTFGTHWLYRGFIDAIEPVDDPEDWSTVKLSCIDALGEAGRARWASEIESHAGELTYLRFWRILSLIRWPDMKRDVSTSAIRPLLAAEMNGAIIDLLRQTAESDGGWAFGDTNGNIVLKNRDWLYYEVGAPPDGTIGNIDVGVLSQLLLEDGNPILLEQGDFLLLEDATTGGVCPGRWIRAFDRKDITTKVILDRDWPSTVETPGPAIIMNDYPSQRLYGVETFQRMDLWTQNDGDLQQIAGRIMATRNAAVSMPRIRSVTVEASMSDEALDLLAQLSVFTPSRYRCQLQKEGRVVFDDTFFAVGVTYDLSAEAWNAEISLDRSYPFEVLDPADYIWDTARWDRSLWN